MANFIFILLIVEITSFRSHISMESALHDCMILRRDFDVAIMTRPVVLVPHFNARARTQLTPHPASVRICDKEDTDQ